MIMINSFQPISPKWIEAGYNVVVGADHGMSQNGYHGGNSDEQRRTALYIISNDVVCGYHEKELTTYRWHHYCANC